MEVNKMEKENLNERLFYAAWDNSVEVAKLLIENGADVKAENKSGYTPLHEAASNNSVGVADLLIKKGVDVKIQNGYCDTLLRDLLRMILNNITTPKL
jgi:ankyrin repeat protein